MSPDDHPRRRASHTGFRFYAGWLYHHVPPVVAMALATGALAIADSAQRDTADTAADAAATASLALALQREQRAARRGAVLEACATDEDLAHVMRIILGDALKQAPATTPARAARIAAARRLYARLFRNLGGLKPLSEREQAARCDARAERAVAPPPRPRPSSAKP